MAYFDKRYHPPGTAPGTLTEVAAGLTRPLRIHLIDFDTDELVVREDVAASECAECLEKETVTWIHVQGHPSEAALRELGVIFHLHSLALEDVLNTGQRPKVEVFDDQLFLILSLPSMPDGRVGIEQVSIFMGRNYVISFYLGDFEPFAPIVKRLQTRGSQLRSRGADFLLHGLLDLVVDQGFPVLENFGLLLEDLEEEILQSPDADTLQKIHSIKRELILLRRMLWPHRDAINQLQRGEHPLIGDGTMIYLRDCYDHSVQVMDLIETYREMANGMLEIYLTSVSNRMNEIMRVLTVIATIFIPLTFVTGVYGMNFDRSAGRWNMPELGWPFGYLAVWLLMILIVALMLLFFRRRKWL